MSVRKLAFPIALAIVWVMMAALALVDFASFSATTSAHRAPVQRAVVRTQPGQG